MERKLKKKFFALLPTADGFTSGRGGGGRVETTNKLHPGGGEGPDICLVSVNGLWLRCNIGIAGRWTDENFYNIVRFVTPDGHGMFGLARWRLAANVQGRHRLPPKRPWPIQRSDRFPRNKITFSPIDPFGKSKHFDRKRTMTYWRFA